MVVRISDHRVHRWPLDDTHAAIVAPSDDGDGGSSPSGAGSLAYVVTSCHEKAGVATLQQELRILHGDAETVTAMSVGPLGPFLSVGLCALLGRGRESLAPRTGAIPW